MSLQTDSIFIQALSDDSTLMEAIGHRLYGTAIPLPDEQADNVPVPYIIVTFDGMQNQTGTKDNYGCEGDEDMTTITVEVAAPTLVNLHELTAAVRAKVRRFIDEADPDADDYDEYPLDYTLSASAIQYDSAKPCYWQTLTYQCATNNN